MTPLALVKKARATSLEPEAWYFVIKANNGEVVATSEMYTRKDDAERGVEDLWSIISSKHFKVEVKVDRDDVVTLILLALLAAMLIGVVIYY